MKVPLPTLDGPYQAGITDPQWPVDPPASIAGDAAAKERYLFERAGRIDPQNFLTVVTADVAVTNRSELSEVLESLSRFVHAQMSRKPDHNHIPILREIPETWRVTVTVGFGASLFLSATGDDRFRLRHHKPRWLRTMPKVVGDAFEPADAAADLIVLISSDHPYVNVSIARALCEGNWGAVGKKETRLTVRTLDQGFSRADRREFGRFDDGIDNLSNARDRELDRFVYVTPQDGEPEWAIGGSYLVWRKIRQRLPRWESYSVAEQEAIFGRRKASGEPLSRATTGPSGMTPVYPSPLDPLDGPLASHIRKVQPRRPGVDLLGVADLDRRFLRRGYPFFDGMAADGTIVCGLLFLAFMHDLRKQFEWPVLNWQTNPDFPFPGAGIDAFYASDVPANMTGGFYFCPPGLKGPEDFLGSAILLT